MPYPIYQNARCRIGCLLFFLLLASQLTVAAPPQGVVAAQQRTHGREVPAEGLERLATLCQAPETTDEKATLEAIERIAHAQQGGLQDALYEYCLTPEEDALSAETDAPADAADDAANFCIMGAALQGSDPDGVNLQSCGIPETATALDLHTLESTPLASQENTATDSPPETLPPLVAAALEEWNSLPQPVVPPRVALVTERSPTYPPFPNVVGGYELMLPSVRTAQQGNTSGNVGFSAPKTPKVTRADVTIVLWPLPSIRVGRGRVLAYEIRMMNYGRGDASNIVINLPYRRSYFKLVGSRFVRNSGDKVSATRSSTITVTAGRLKAGQRRTGTLYLRIASTLATDSVISMRASYVTRDQGGTRRTRSNWAPVLVGSGNDTGRWVWMSVEPVRGPRGTKHRFFTDRFVPGELVYAWINTPSGPRNVSDNPEADRDGRVSVTYTSSNLSPGTYSLVLYGARSNLTAIATFYVE